MRLLWWIPIAVLAAGAGLLVRMRRRRNNDVTPTTEPVSSDWLARARGREEQRWP
jgi:cytochrome c-type biogenesis protein CcmH/NrfF